MTADDMPDGWEDAARAGWDESPAARAYRLGQAAYAGYCAASGGKSLISGAPLPTWGAQQPRIQDAWIGAAMAVLAANGGKR